MNNKFVSRGGQKLEHALQEFNLDVTGYVVLDVGSSTGGFVDCLLQHGVAKVYSLDTAYGELAWKLRQNPKVVVMERKNILYLESFPEMVDLVTIDVTFTSLERILPIVKKFLKPTGKIIALVKPQYENSPLALKNQGVIPESMRSEILDKIIEFAENNGFQVLGKTDSPILGGSGNKEYFLLLGANQE